MSVGIAVLIGGNLYEILGFSLIIMIPNAILLARNLTFAKKVFFRIRSDGIEAGTPYYIGFIPFDRIVWIGPSPKPFSVDIERRFNIVDIRSLYPAPLIISPYGLMVAFNGINHTFGLIIYPTDSFADKMKDRVDQRFRSRHPGAD